MRDTDSHRTGETGMPQRLAPLVAAARQRAERLRATTSAEALLADAQRFARRSLIRALHGSAPAIIAEVKRASPSKGVFRDDFDPTALAGAYVAGGAAAISVVTEPTFFHGEPAWITLVRDATELPVLHKDFFIDPIQIAESASLGADAVLLIARILPSAVLRELSETAASAGLEILFEAHDEADLEKIARLDPSLIGVNARNLDDFTVDAGAHQRLRAAIAPGVTTVAESGIASPRQIRDLSRIGYHAFLIGELLVTSDDPVATLCALRDDTHA